MSKKKEPEQKLPLWIEYVPVEDLKDAPRNPKQHSLEEIKASMRRFGFVMPGGVNEQTGAMFAGHGRRDALISMKMAGEPAPVRIIEKDGKWFAPILRGVAFKDEQEAEAYLLADNRLTKIGGEDEELLAKMIAELSAMPGGTGMVGVGYDDKEISRMIAEAGGGGGPADESRSLATQFLVPPFSVLDARQGYWQDRKRGWLALGIQSEIGRGGGSELRVTGQALAVPGGSPRPAMKLVNGHTVRGDGRGREL